MTLPHSIDFHSSEVAPDAAFKTVPAGGRHKFSFVAKHPGVFMYHCATQPVLMHTGAGMVGMMVVKPRGLRPARELWMTQQEYYMGKPGADPSMIKMQAKHPDVIAFNGYASHYKGQADPHGRGERIRIYVMNAGPSIWSGFHVIGTVFDRTVIEGTRGRDAQTVNLAPAQGGWVEFTLDEEGADPFVTHGFGDMVRGAVGVLATAKAAKGDAGAQGSNPAKPEPAASGPGTVNVELGEMFARPSVKTVKAGKVTFVARNVGQIPHELMVERVPVKMVAPGQPDEKAALGMVEDLEPGQSGRLTLRLDPGIYELFCNIPGHYALGQRTVFTVTGRS